MKKLLLITGILILLSSCNSIPGDYCYIITMKDGRLVPASNAYPKEGALQIYPPVGDGNRYIISPHEYTKVEYVGDCNLNRLSIK